METMTARKTQSKEGGILLTVIGVLVIFGVLLGMLLQLTQTSAETELLVQGSNQAQLVAESGLQYAQSVYCNLEDTWTDPTTLSFLNGDRVTIQMTNGDTQFLVTSTVFSGTAMEARAQVVGSVPTCEEDDEEEASFPSEPQVASDFTIFSRGTLTGLNSTFIEGNLYLNEDLTVENSGTEITGSIVTTGQITFENTMTIGGNLISDGPITIESSISVVGDIRSDEAVKFEAFGSTVGGDIHSAKTVDLIGRTAVSGSIYAKEAITIEGTNSSVDLDLHSGKNISIEASSALGGSLFADEGIKLEGSTTAITGSVHSGKDVEFTVSTSVDGSVFADEKVKFEISGTSVGGDVHAGYEVEDESRATITGQVFEGAAATAPTPPIPPMDTNVSPLASPNRQYSFPKSAPNANIILRSFTVPPGSWKNLRVIWGILIFEASDTSQGDLAPMNYSIWTFWPWEGIIRLDLSGTGNIHIAVEQGIINSFGRIQFEVTTDGSNWTAIQDLDRRTAVELAKRVYWEVYGDFNITQANNEWFGTVLAAGDISLPDEFFAVGCFAVSGSSSEISLAGNNHQIIYSVANFAVTNW